MTTKIEPYKSIAEAYDEIRPSYPQELIEDIIIKTGVSLDNKILEVGAGTGKATIQFAERGYGIHAIELGVDMAKILKDKCRNYPRISFEIADFDKWQNSSDKPFDMIYSAQAFHWLDPVTKYEKCHKLLKDDGYLVLFWYTSSEDSSERGLELSCKIDEIVKKYTYKKGKPEDKPQRRAHNACSDKNERSEEINSSGYFEQVEKKDYRVETKNSAEQFIKVMNSVPAFASIMDGLAEKEIEEFNREITEIISEHGGYVSSILEFSLYIAKKKIQKVYY